MRKPLNIFLLLILAVALGLNALLRRDPSQRTAEVLADMFNSTAYKSQAENSALEGGNTSLQPVAGTIARGYPPLHYGLTPEEAKRAGGELVNPLSVDDTKSLDRGGAVYGNFCAVCHGPSGNGDGTVTTRGFPPPPSLHAENALRIADGQMFHLITFGQRNMPGYATQVSREDRWKVILYIRSLQKKQTEAAKPNPENQPAVAPANSSKEARP